MSSPIILFSTTAAPVRQVAKREIGFTGSRSSVGEIAIA